MSHQAQGPIYPNQSLATTATGTDIDKKGPIRASEKTVTVPPKTARTQGKTATGTVRDRYFQVMTHQRRAGAGDQKGQTAALRSLPITQEPDSMTSTLEPRTWTLIIPAPTIKPVTKRKTGKTFTRKPWLNSNDRDHWRVISPIRKEWRELGKEHAEMSDIPKGLDHVEIHAHIHRPTHRKADVGNYYPTIKAIVDGLTDYGLFDDDNDDHLTGPFLHPGTVGPAAVTLTITEEAHQA